MTRRPNEVPARTSELVHKTASPASSRTVRPNCVALQLPVSTISMRMSSWSMKLRRLVKAEFGARHRDHAEARKIAQLRLDHQLAVGRGVEIDLRERAPVDVVARRDPFTGSEGLGREVTRLPIWVRSSLVRPCIHKRGVRVSCPFKSGENARAHRLPHAPIADCIVRIALSRCSVPIRQHDRSPLPTRHSRRVSMRAPIERGPRGRASTWELRRWPSRRATAGPASDRASS